MKTPDNKQNEATAIQAITSGTVKEHLMALAPEMGIELGKDAKCSAEQYGALIMLTLHKLALLPVESLEGAMQAWNYIPKNPSAMRQIFENANKESTSPAVSSLIAKFLPKAPETK